MMNKQVSGYQRLARMIPGAFALLALGFVETVSAQDVLSQPVWSDLFNANGTLKDVVNDAGEAGSNGVPDYVDIYGGTDAIFVGDNISDGVAVDMSALFGADTLNESLVYNGPVASSHDLGNAFILATTDSQGNQILYGAVERLGPADEGSYIEFEFSQGVVRVRQGDPWPIHGQRTTDDLLIRVNLASGSPASIDVSRWTEEGGYESVNASSISAGSRCTNIAPYFIVCDASLVEGSFTYQSSFDPVNDSWDQGGNSVQVSPPNGLLEFGVNVGVLLGANPEFTSIIVRSPDDILLDSFKNSGYWALGSNLPSDGAN